MGTDVRVLAPAIVALSLAAGVAHADTSAADMAAARTLGTEGIKLANKGKCAEAVDKLDRAEKLFHAPTTLAKLGECHVELGKVVQGTEELRRVVREPLAEGAPKPFVHAKARAEKILAQAQPRIAMLRLVLAPAAANAEATVDGDALSAAAVGTDWPIDPGEHTIRATANGYLEATAKVTLRDGEKKEVSLTLSADPNAKGATTVAATSPAQGSSGAEPGARPPSPTTPDRREREGEGPSRLPAYVAFGVGAAGLVVGGAAGVIFLGKKSDLEKACPDKTCPTSHGGDLDSTKTWGNVATIGLAVGAVGVATGFVLLLATGGSSSDRSAAAGVRPTVGLGTIGVDGRF